MSRKIILRETRTYEVELPDEIVRTDMPAHLSRVDEQKGPWSWGDNVWIMNLLKEAKLDRDLWHELPIARQQELVSVGSSSRRRAKRS